MKYLGRYLSRLLGRSLTRIFGNLLPDCIKDTGILVAWYKNLTNANITGIDPSDSLEYHAVDDAIGARKDTVFHGQYLSSGSIDFHRAVQIDYIDPSDGSFVEGVDVPTGVLAVPANGICNIGAYPREGVVDGLLNFDGIDDYVSTDGDYTVPDNGFIEFNTYLNKESGYLTTGNIGQLLLSFGRHASSGSDSYVSLRDTNLQFWIANTNQIYTYPLAGLSKTILTIRFEWVAGILTVFSINGITQTPISGSGGGFGSTFMNFGGLVGNYFLSDAYIWDVNINDEHIYICRPAGNLDSAWVDQSMAVVSVPNAGSNGTTDWVNPTNGLAEDWQKSNIAFNTSIVTGNGFIGNAQRIEAVDTGNYYIFSDFFDVTVGQDYILSCKYRSNETTTGGSSAQISVVRGIGIPVEGFEFDENTSDAVLKTSSSFTATETPLWLIIRAGNTVGNYVEVDEIKLIEANSLDGTVNGSPTTTSVGESQEDYTYTTYYPVCERAGTVLHDIMASSIHSSITTPVWGETLYGTDYLNQVGYTNKADYDGASLAWESIVNSTPITLDDNAIIPLVQWEWVDLQDSNGENILDSNGEQLQVKEIL